ncbi:MAG: hypothetical protein EOP83_28780 [Verrucomicrobiaceae bacterium]|nr:MAG: hypothetical protein EOP83_28780 [Verrucomicrobiaceae bacterium]
MYDEHSMRVMRALEPHELAALGPGDVEAFEVVVRKDIHRINEGAIAAYMREHDAKHVVRFLDDTVVYLFNDFVRAFHFKMSCG